LTNEKAANRTTPAGGLCFYRAEMNRLGPNISWTFQRRDERHPSGLTLWYAGGMRTETAGAIAADGEYTLV